MAIILADGFIIDTPGPIDSRYRVQNYSDLSSVPQIYVGLQVYVISEDRTYVYKSNGEWKLTNVPSNTSIDINTNITNNNWQTNIYASGSIVLDTEINLATVSNSRFDRSFYFSKWATGLVGNDESRISSYFYRSADGQDYDTMSYRMLYSVKAVTRTNFTGPPSRFEEERYQRSGFFEFNSSRGSYIGKNDLLIGVGTMPNFDTIRDTTFRGTNELYPKLSIDMDSIKFYCSIGGYNSTSDLDGWIQLMPIFKFHRRVLTSERLNDVVIGINSSNDTTKYYSDVPHLPSYRMVLKNAAIDTVGVSRPWQFDIRPGSVVKATPSTEWVTAMEIENKDLSTVETSPVRFLVDTSRKDWLDTETKNFQLLSFQDMFRKLPHKYTRTQMLSITDTFTITGTTLFLPITANLFNVVLPSNTVIESIKPLSDATDFPVGTILYIRFRNEPIQKIYDLSGQLQKDFVQEPAKNTGSFIRIKNGNRSMNTEFVSEVTDATTRSDENYMLSITHFDGRPENKIERAGFRNIGYGDLITIRRNISPGSKTPHWEIIEVNRQTKIPRRTWSPDFGTETMGDDNRLDVNNNLKDSPTGRYLIHEYANQYYWALGGSDFTSIDMLNYGTTNTFKKTYVYQYKYPDSDTILPYKKDNPGIWTYTSTSTGVPRDFFQLGPPAIGSILTPKRFSLQFSSDGNRIVHCRGTFELIFKPTKPDNTVQKLRDNVSGNTIYFKSVDNKKNIWSIGKLFDTYNGIPVANPLYPQWECNWTFAQMSGSGLNSSNIAVEITFTDVVFSVNKSGQIFLECYMEPKDSTLLNYCTNLRVRVSVKPFSYIGMGITQSMINKYG